MIYVSIYPSGGGLVLMKEYNSFEDFVKELREDRKAVLSYKRNDGTVVSEMKITITGKDE